MNRLVLRKHFLMILAVLFSVALPVHAAGIGRVYFFQTDTFELASNAMIVVGTNYTASLYSVRVGDLIRVSYDREHGALVVHEIADGVRRKAPPNTSFNMIASLGKAYPHSKGEPLLYMNGIVRAVDLSSGTVKIAHARRQFI